MENSLGLQQLKLVVKRISFDQDPTGYQIIQAIIGKFHKIRNELLWYLVLCTEGKYREEILEDDAVDFIMDDSTTLAIEHVVRIISDNHQFIADMIRNGHVAITLPFVEYFLNNHCAKEPKKGATCEKCREILPSAVMDKMGLLIKTGDISYLEQLSKALCTAYKEKFTKGQVFFENFTNDGAIFHLYTPLEHLIQSIKLVHNEFRFYENIEFYQLHGDYFNTDTSGENDVDDLMAILLLNVENLLKVMSIENWMQLAELSSALKDGKSMQEVIGNSIYEVKSLIAKYNIEISSDFRECLNQLQIKPLTEDELINACDWKELLIQLGIDSSIDEIKRKKMFSAFVGRPEPWQEHEGIKCILANFHLSPTSEIVNRCLSKIHEETDPDYLVTYSSLFLSSFEKLEVSLQIECLHCRALHDALPHLRRNDIPELTVLCNQLSKESDVMITAKKFIVLALQNPLETSRQLFQLATSSSDTLEICLEIIKIMTPIIGNARHDYYTRVLGEYHCDKEWENIKTIFDKSFNEIWSDLRPTYLLQVMEAFDKYLSDMDWENAGHMLKITEVLHSRDNLDAVYLAHIAQALTQSSWDSKSFNYEKVHFYGVCLEYHNSIKSRYVKNDLVTKWLKNYVKTLPELIQTHFCYLWDTEDMYLNNNDLHVEILISARSQKPLRQSIFKEELHVIALLKVIPHMHSSEWPQLFKAYRDYMETSASGNSAEAAFSILAKSVRLLSIISSEDMLDCFEYTMNCLAEVFTNISDIKSTVLLHDLLAPVNEINSNKVRDRCYLRMQPLIVKYFKNYLDIHDIEYIHTDWRSKIKSAVEIA